MVAAADIVVELRVIADERRLLRHPLCVAA